MISKKRIAHNPVTVRFHCVGKLSCFSVLLFAMCFGGCAGGYFADRGRDAVDIFSLSVGKGMGLKGRIGPVATGVFMEYTAYGLRGGEIVRQDLSQIEKNYQTLQAVDGGLVIYGVERFNITELNRGKNFTASSWVGDIPIPYTSTLDSASGFEYYTQIEAVVALYYSLRVGFNPGELLDFILGWTTIDIFNDDIGRKRKPDPDLRTQ